ncbi:MAG TPA: hypothetical protein ENN31_01950 [Candidatus Vogelbacteria bacterium]|nr:hypothetical protein [Candidatus Vogelbacteria bacterium]
MIKYLNISLLIIVFILLIILFFILVDYFIFNKEDVDSEEIKLSEEVARQLVIDNWGDCDEFTCRELVISVEEKNNLWEITAIYDGLFDDSVRALRKIISAFFEEGEWVLGEASITHRCQPGRGHQNFSTEFCF